MPYVHLASPTVSAAVHAELAYLRAQLPPGSLAKITPSYLVRTLLEDALATRRRERDLRAARLLEQFLPVPRAVAARWFKHLKGAVPLDELQSAAYEEALKAARKFRPEEVGATWENLGAAPKPYLTRWADWGVKALLKQKQEEGQDIHPDGDEGSRWERIGGESAPDLTRAVDLERALATFPRGRQRRILRHLARGAGYDDTAEHFGCSVEDVRASIHALRMHLSAQGVDHAPDEELTVAEAAERYGVSAKSITKRITVSQTLRGRKLNGRWTVMAADVAEVVRARSSDEREESET